jgi:hypothetical protein
MGAVPLLLHNAHHFSFVSEIQTDSQGCWRNEGSMDRDEERGRGLGVDEPFFLSLSRSSISTMDFKWRKNSVLLPENLRTCFEPSVQAWILYKAPQWNACYPNSCPERIKLKMHWGCGPRPLLRGWFREDGLRGQNLNMVLTIITLKTIHNINSNWIISKSLGSNL